MGTDNVDVHKSLPEIFEDPGFQTAWLHERSHFRYTDVLQCKTLQNISVHHFFLLFFVFFKQRTTPCRAVALQQSWMEKAESALTVP